jgi:hypothetical protein
VVDNCGSPDLPVDVTIATFGGSYATVNLPWGVDSTDLVVWGAVQTGDWYGRDHLAASVAVEMGHRWSGRSPAPWLRGGFLWASGDADGDDERHGTFFQMLPSSRKYALSSVYAQMNVRDVFAQLLIEPRRFKARIETCPSPRERAISGIKAAARCQPWPFQRIFGRAEWRTALGTVVEGAIDVPIPSLVDKRLRRHDVRRRRRPTVFTTNVSFWSVENVIRF